MLISGKRVDQAMGAHLQRIYKTNATGAVQRASRRDVAMISGFAALVELGRARALSAPEIRAERLAQARAAVQSGSAAPAEDVAASMINRAVEGQV